MGIRQRPKLRPAPIKPVQSEHDKLCDLAGRWLRNVAKYPVVFVEMRTWLRETPDAIAFDSTSSILIECKTSRADFLADRKKPFRSDPSKGVGYYRYYMAPAGLISVDELPDRWGLIEASGGKATLVHGKHPKRYSEENPFSFPEFHSNSERMIMFSALRRAKGLSRLERENKRLTKMVDYLRAKEQTT